MFRRIRSGSKRTAPDAAVSDVSELASAHASEDAPDTVTEPPPSLASFRSLIGVSVLVRLWVDTGVQLFNPFLPVFAAGLNTNAVVLGRLVGLRSAVGLVAPLFGALADRHGFRPVLRIGLLLGAVGSLLVGSSQTVAMAAVGMVVWGIGIAAFVPTLQAYLSARLPYSLRARGIGILEYAWALAGIVGLFAMGYLIEAVGWRAPFYVIGVGLGVAAIAYGFVPSTRLPHHGPAPKIENAPASTAGAPGAAGALTALQRFFWLGENATSAYATILSSGLFFTAAVQVMIAHSVWLSSEYGLGAAQLGTVALVLGVADLCGSGLVSLFTDRWGKRRSVLLGCTGALCGYLLMPLLNKDVFLAVVSIAVARGAFEFAIVSNIPLLSEQVPAQRGKLMTMGAAFNLIGATVAGITGPWLYTRFGVLGLSSISFLLTAAAIVVLLKKVHEGASA